MSLSKWKMKEWAFLWRNYIRSIKDFTGEAKAKEQVKDGAGVGLYLARRIIEEQGGTIAAKRKAENGMIFKVTLPLIIGE